MSKQAKKATPSRQSAAKSKIAESSAEAVARAGGRPMGTRVPMGENRHDRFKRLAISRMNRVLQSLRLLGQLTSENYTYDKSDAEAIERTLQKATEATLNRFKKGSLEPFDLY